MVARMVGAAALQNRWPGTIGIRLPSKISSMADRSKSYSSKPGMGTPRCAV
jgi:hypothetical protein